MIVHDEAMWVSVEQREEERERETETDRKTDIERQKDRERQRETIVRPYRNIPHIVSLNNNITHY